MRTLSFSSTSSTIATSVSAGSLSCRDNTPIEDIPAIVEAAHVSFETGVSISVLKRRVLLERLHKQLLTDRRQLVTAIEQDFHRHASETELIEIGELVAELNAAIKSLDSWTRSKTTSFDPKLFSTAPHLTKEPYGVVLVVGPCNYPYLCLVGPIISAIAAGNCVIAKPSEVCPNSCEAILRTLESALDPKVFRSVTGGPAETQVLLQQKFDKICFTGSKQVGKIVYQAAVENFTPVMLELGGKCPAIVSPASNLKSAAKRIAWGKFINAGQTCVAPDYVLVDRSVQDAFVKELMIAVEELYPNLNENTRDFTHMITMEAWERANKLVQETKGTLRQFGHASKATRFFPPSVVFNVKVDDVLMEDEIFSPILPIIPVESVKPKIVKPIIRRHDTPLAVYIFSDHQGEIDALRSIRCAAILANDTIMQASSPSIKFGGFGQSGMGSYHGKHGFDAFTFERPYLNQPKIFENGLQFRYPPYTKNKQSIIENTLNSNIAVVKGSITGFLKGL